MAQTQVRSKQQIDVNSNVSWKDLWRITNLVDPTAPQDAATKAYVDAVKQGLYVKDSCRVATTGAETYEVISGNVTIIYGTTIDGVSIALGDRILIKNAPASSGAGAGSGTPNTTQPANGIYEVTGLGTDIALTRAIDANISAEVRAGMFTFVTEGTDGEDNGFVLVTDDDITLGTTPLKMVQFSGAGMINAGAGLTKTGNTLNVVTADPTRILVNADSIDLGTPSINTTTVVAGLRKFDYDVYGRISAIKNADVSDIYNAIGAQSPNLFIASPTSGSGNVALRSIVAQDIDGVAVTSITGTANQVNASASVGNVTLSLPQDIHSGATPQFKGANLVFGATLVNSPILSLSQEWNAGAVTFDALSLSITDTASHANSLLAKMAVGGSTVFAVRKDGAIVNGAWKATIVEAQYGGTGFGTYAVGDLLYANTTSTLAKLADVAIGNALISGGVNTAPTWGKIGLTTHVTGVLPVANGGIGTGLVEGDGIGIDVTTGVITISNTGVLGSGTVNFLPIWTATNELGDSGVYQTIYHTSVKGIGFKPDPAGSETIRFEQNGRVYIGATTSANASLALSVHAQGNTSVVTRFNAGNLYAMTRFMQDETNFRGVGTGYDVSEQAGFIYGTSPNNTTDSLLKFVVLDGSTGVWGITATVKKRTLNFPNLYSSASGLSTGDMYYDANGILRLAGVGTGGGAGSGITGTGTAGYSASWSGAGTLANGTIYAVSGRTIVNGTTDDGVSAFQVIGAGKFSSTVTASQFIKSGGASYQYLMADGSVSTISGLIAGLSTGYVPYATSSVSLGNTGLYTNGTDYAIGGTTFYTGMGAPSLSFSGATNSGGLMFAVGGYVRAFLGHFGDQFEVGTDGWLALSGSYIRFSFGGFERARIAQTTGNLLLGTTTDSGYKLDVTGTARVTSTLTASSFVKSGGVSGEFLMANGSVLTGGLITSLTSGYIPKATGSAQLGNSLIYDNGSGVGINTTLSGYTSPSLLVASYTTPSIPFQVIADNGGRIVRLYTSDYNNSNTGTSLRISFGAGSGNTYSSIQNFISGETALGDIALNPSGGNVGIGTPTPSSYQLGGKFAVAGSTSGFYFNDANNRLVLDGAGTNRDLSLYFRYSNSATIITDGYLVLSTNNSERGRITAGGNWLINTTTDAGYKLDVNGTGRFSYLTTSGTNIFDNGGGRAIDSYSDGVLFAKIGGAHNIIFGDGAVRYFSIYTPSGAGTMSIRNFSTSTDLLTFAPTGAATFSSSVAVGGASNLYKLTVNTNTNVNFGVGVTSFTGTNNAVFLSAVDGGSYGSIPMALNASIMGFYTGFTEAGRITGGQDWQIGGTGVSGGGKLQVTGDVNISGQFKINGSVISTGGGVPTSRNITINGVTQDLSADRSWTVSGGGGGIGGSGTAGYVAKFSSTYDITNAGLYDGGTYIDVTSGALKIAGKQALSDSSTTLNVGFTGFSTVAIYANTTSRIEANSQGVKMNIPTSSSGLSSGQLWNDGGTIKMV